MWACSFFLPMICELFLQEKDCIAISWMAEFSAFCPSYFWAIGVPKHIDIKSNSLQGLPAGFRRFEDGSFSMKTKVKIRSNVHSRMKMWRTRLYGLLNSEDYKLSHMSRMTTAFWKLVKTDNLKIPITKKRKMKTLTCTGSPITRWSHQFWETSQSMMNHNYQIENPASLQASLFLISNLLLCVSDRSCVILT